MADAFEPVSQALASSKFSAVAPFIRDDQYTLRDLGKLRARSVAWTLLGLLVSVIGLAGAGFIYVTRSPGLPEDVGTGALICLVPCLGLYMVLLAAFVRMRAVSGHFPELAAFDSRKPILYLRNFATENPNLASETGLPITVKASFEHLIGTYFWNYGRVVALGDPLQRRPAGSVSRLFVTDAGWRQGVAGAMEQAQAIIIHYGAGANVDWEVDQTARFPQAPRLVIMNLTRRPEQKRVSDVAAPAALQATFAGSKRKLPTGPDVMIGVVRDRNGETILAGDPTAQTLGKYLTRLKRALPPRTSAEDLPPAVKAIRDKLHFWTYLPVFSALPGIVALLLLLGAAWLTPGLLG